MEWNGMEWNETEGSGMEWNEMKCNVMAMTWNGMAMKWNGMNIMLCIHNDVRRSSSSRAYPPGVQLRVCERACASRTRSERASQTAARDASGERPIAVATRGRVPAGSLARSSLRRRRAWRRVALDTPAYPRRSAPTPTTRTLHLAPWMPPARTCSCSPTHSTSDASRGSEAAADDEDADGSVGHARSPPFAVPFATSGAALPAASSAHRVPHSSSTSHARAWWCRGVQRCRGVGEHQHTIPS